MAGIDPSPAPPETLGELQGRIAELPHATRWADAHDQIADLVDMLDRAARPGLAPGRTVRLPAADGYAVYVVLQVGPVTSRLLHVPIHDGWTHAAVDERGSCRTSLVRRVVENDDRTREAFSERERETEAFYASLHPGSHVHFLSSSGPIRCEVTHGRFTSSGKTREGICLRPLAFVGTLKHQVGERWTGDVWAYDLYLIDPTGRVEYGYHAQRIRSGELFRCSLHDLYESGHARARVEDPRPKPTLSLEPPEPSEEEAERRRLWRAAHEAATLLAPGASPLAHPREQLVAAHRLIGRALAT